MMRKLLLVLVSFAVLGTGAFYYLNRDSAPFSDSMKLLNGRGGEEQAGESDDGLYEVIGASVEGREIHAYGFPSTSSRQRRAGGTGGKKIVLVGAIHGGYEWNTAILVYKFIDHFTENPDTIPQNTEVVVIPVANPDGLYKALGTSGRFEAKDAPQFALANEVSFESDVAQSRFNANRVDLNRNFDCGWQSDGVWREHTVSAGSAPFSEPESRALRDFFLRERPDAVIFYHSAGGGVYASGCGGETLPASKKLADTYGGGAGTASEGAYTLYVVTGDAADWLAKEGIPAITVELSTHDVIEFEKNLAGVSKALEEITD